ncbi:MAG TPA: hypothetical protein VMW83_09940 [Spirochaetia bacterium]|nr:hypothetical protein [Spirochaetia bacterium]
MESALVKISAGLLTDTYQALEELARSRGWSIEEAVRIIIDEGIASRRAVESLAKMDGLSDAEKVIRLLAMLKDAGSDYASLKFQNYAFFQDNKILQMNLTGYKSKIDFLEMYIGKLKEEIALFKGRQEELPSE